MPIGDLLAQIEGKSATSTVPTKRKAYDEPREAVGRKTPRLNTPSSSANSYPETANPSSNPFRSSTPRLSSASSRNTTSSSNPARPTHSSSRPTDRISERPPAIVRKPASSQPPSRLPPLASNIRNVGGALPKPLPSANTVPKAPPKKGSYAEIMARASRAQSTKPAGSIQHKPIEKGLSKKEREEARLERMRKPQGDARQGKKVAPGARPGQTLGSGPRRGPAPPSTSKNGAGTGYMGTARAPARVATSGKKTAAPPPEPEKKIKKTALAATGYTGTARPQAAPLQKSRPTDGKSSASPARTGRRTEEPKSAFSAFTRRPKPSKYDDDEDSEMDDFIVDDEDDEGGGRGNGYNYGSDASSDMEAGLDDVWNEEAQASRIARVEDAKQDALLRQKAAEKSRRLGR